MKRTVLSALCVCAIATLGLSTIASAEKLPAREYVPPSTENPWVDIREPLVLKQGGDTLWLQVYTTGEECPGSTDHGGETTGGPGLDETFCFENYDPITGTKWAYYGSDGTYFAESTGNGFSHVDARTLGSPSGEDYWNVDTYQAYNPGGFSWWCGAETGDRCDNWDEAPGYGNQWNQLLALSPSLYSATLTSDVPPGTTVYLDCYVRYDTECDYDYAYLEYTNDGGATWAVLGAGVNPAQFNGTSGAAGDVCGDDYFDSSDPHTGAAWLHYPTTESDAAMTTGAPADFMIGFRFESDGAWSDKDGDDTDGAFFVDEVEVYWYETVGMTHETLEFEDMDSDYEPDKWAVLPAAGLCDKWWMAYDPDPPYEPAEGATICETNASWVWSACPYEGGAWRIPTYCNGFLYRLMTPKVYTGWGNVPPYNIPKEYAGLVVQNDVYVCFKEATCDYYDTKINVYDPSPASGVPGWCGWKNIDGYIYYGGCDFMNVDTVEDVSQFLGAGVDSAWYAWDIMDVGETDDFCWTTLIPKPHRLSQIMIDNVSLGIFDGSATFFHARVIDMFQDSFDLDTPAHNALLANGDMPKFVLDVDESLTVDIHDLNGLAGAGAIVDLYYSVDKGATWRNHAMDLESPDPSNPNLGGTYRGSITPAQAYGDASTQWTAGTEVWYYIYVKDDGTNEAWWPADAEPGTPPPTHPEWQLNYYEFSILPGTGEKYEEIEGDRILLCDDFGRGDEDYHPAMAETNYVATENFYESVLYDLGYCYDKYDVQGASTGLTNEPWGIRGPHPVVTDSIINYYDCVIWFISRFDEYTVKDTMQCRLRDFVLDGGNLFICGNSIGEDMTNSGAYDDEAADTCGFYESLCGAYLQTGDAECKLGIKQPYWYAIGNGTGGLTSADTFMFHLGCPISVPHDKLRINPTPNEPWSNPVPFLEYVGGYSPGDTLVAIYNDVTDGGKVVYMSMEMAAMVDSTSTRGRKGRSQLMSAVLSSLFAHTAQCPHFGGVSDDVVAGGSFAYSLDQNRPNPFNPATDIAYSIRDAGKVTLKVYNVRGQVVKTLVDRPMQPGQYYAHWDGTNQHGQLVSSGIYFCKMQASDFSATRKMVLLK